jgi:hypothetical protein
MAVLGGASDVGTVGVAAAMAAGYMPLVVDFVESHAPAPHVFADTDKRGADEALAAHAPIHGAILCPGFGASRPGLVGQWLGAVLRAVPGAGVIVGIASEQAARGGPCEDRQAELRGDRDVLRRVRSLQDSAGPGVRACLVLHDKLVPAFEDCRGETQEIPGQPGELGRADVADAIRFLLALTPAAKVRQLVVQAATPDVAAMDPSADATEQ